MSRGPRSVAGRSSGPRRAIIVVLLLVLVIATVLGVYFARTRETPVAGGVVTEGVVINVSGTSGGGFSLLPPFADVPPARDVAGLLYRGLTKTGPDGRPQPELASRWDVDATVKTFTFHLRPGLRWSDGAMLSSADAIYTLGVLQDPSLAQTQIGQAWGGITATAPDALTIIYTLPAPSAGFVNLTELGIIPEHTLKPRPVAALREATDAPTSGPFRVDLVARDHIALRRNNHSFEHPWLDGIDLKLFSSTAAAVQALLVGDIDSVAGLTTADAARVGSTVNREVLRAGSFAYTELLFNQKQGALSDSRVRHAIGQAIDRGREISGPLNGYARLDGSPIPSTISWAAAADPGPKLDPTAAGKALDAAGWKLPHAGSTRTKGGQPLVLKLAAEDLEPFSTVAREAVSDLAGVGIQVKLSLVASRDLLSALQGRSFDMALTALDNGPDPDIYVLWHSTEAAAGGFNFSGMTMDPFLDKDLEDGRFHFDTKTRKAAYLDAQKILRANQPAVFLYCPDIMVGFNDRVRGTRLSPAIESGGRYDFVSDWYVNSQRVWK